jgi:hypothetical protein
MLLAKLGVERKDIANILALLLTMTTLPVEKESTFAFVDQLLNTEQ